MNILRGARLLPRVSAAARSFSTSRPSMKEHTIEIEPMKTHNLDGLAPSTSVTITDEELMKLIKDMMVIRRMETACGDLYKSRFIRGFCHLYSGQEAVATGIKSVCNEIDTIITSYRCHGYTYLCGEKPEAILAELLGRKDGVSGGRGGSMHLYTPTFFGGNGIVGAQVPLGAGLAFAHKFKNDGGVNFAAYGDGAANQGQIFEAFNMAKLWKLPSVFVCENNRYGMGTSQERSSANFQYYTRGDYIPGIQVDGMDILAIREGARFTSQYCRDGNGPILMESVTYRYGGHSMSDPGTSYRTRDEVKKMKSNSDPIMNLRHRIVDLGVSTDAELDTMQKDIRKEIDAAVEFAKASPEPTLDSMFDHVYQKPLENVRGADNFSQFNY